ncbi:hypothetical protein SU69_00050 [Thermosipho melanesiensis]|uniref:Uncharacterized protein n=1 Tax=Thermosipho melanesiensis TaxID=46541 RepID=A0ABM6GGV0_9BACT|nr:hypothetical protein BW47_00050 [Thermosipho melanesiensis]OOC38493.1 hypothetical protein SU68_00050 [Thermosipho melanesiensis]OOC40297.1 hypothetical protein SU70_00050 [Thermosipho melanesiensis]OOC40561.1 hypothetical protein SU69_00050 [Thermosipho melanesiensis]OOC44408.1 hypothetical protein SU71_00050 [Thermosipho melanesiensis]
MFFKKRSSKWGIIIFFSVPIMFCLFILLGISEVHSDESIQLSESFIVLFYFLWRTFFVPVILLISMN